MILSVKHTFGGSEVVTILYVTEVVQCLPSSGGGSVYRTLMVLYVKHVIVWQEYYCDLCAQHTYVRL